MVSGCLYSIGVGPGDPELMTLKAVHTISKCPVLVLPAESRQKCVAYQIARQILPEIDEKEAVCLVMPMTKDKEKLEGRDAAFLTIGDPTVYATSMYIHQRVAQMGYQTQIISGVPSFCAAAAKLGVSLGEKQEQIHVIPASYDIEMAMQLSGTKILMKAGKKMPFVKQCVKKHQGWAAMVENCGMPDEHVWINPDSMPDQPGYYTLVIAKDGRGEEK